MLWLDEQYPPHFPPLHFCTEDGLLAAGGSLDKNWLLAAYQSGLFPWSMPGEPILWWSPDPRSVIFPEEFHVSRSFKRFLKKSRWTVKISSNFQEVIHQCAATRGGPENTWLNPEMQERYLDLHKSGWAQSFEVWDEDSLVGGVYGPVISPVYCGESMFSLQSNGSKVALWAASKLLPALGCTIIDTQLPNPHLEQLGCSLISRDSYLKHLKKADFNQPSPWPKDFEVSVAQLLKS